MSDLKVHPKLRPQHYDKLRLYLIPLRGCSKRDYANAVAALDLLTHPATRDEVAVYKMLCAYHPKYRAIRKPAIYCRTCWKAYNERHEKS